jgi:hypothetical protein
VACEHVAHALLREHRFPVHAGGLISGGQGVGDGVFGERIGIQFPVELANSGDETRSGVVGDKVADCRRPADGAQMTGAIQRMERVLNADGELILQIADDQVESSPSQGESTQQSRREVEVELGPAGKKKDLKRAGRLLRDAGATLSAVRTKLDRVLGPVYETHG